MIICAPIEGGIPFWLHSKPSKWLHIKKMETFGGLCGSMSSCNNNNNDNKNGKKYKYKATAAKRYRVCVLVRDNSNNINTTVKQ